MRQTAPVSGRDRFIPVAADLFTRKGFGPVGLDEVIAAAGVTKTTFYKHFSGKDELIVAVLAHQHRVEMADLLADLVRLAGDDPRGRILAIFDVFDEWFTDPDFRGCMFLNAATEFPQEHDPIHRAALQHSIELGQFIRETAVAAGAAGDAADAIADQMLLLITGAIVSRQAARQVTAARTARLTAALVLDRLLPVPSTAL